MSFGKATLVSFEAASAAEGLEWAHELLGRARRAAVRARLRAVGDRPVVRLAACGLFASAVAGMVWWATGLLAHL